MSHSSLILFAGLASLAVVASWAPGCALGDNANCVNWVRNGMCVNPAYTNAQLRAYCPNACPNSGCNAPPAATVTTMCNKSDHPNCVSWAKNGFCTNPGYTKDMVQQYCPTVCTNSGCAAGGATTTTAAPKVENKNCGTWNTDPVNVFCASATAVQKTNFCFDTCKEELKTPLDDCAIYVNTAGKVVRTAVPKNPTNDDVTATKADATNKLLYVFTRKGCKATTASLATGSAAANKVQDYDGTAGDTFSPITVAAEQEAAGIVCVCQ